MKLYLAQGYCFRSRINWHYTLALYLALGKLKWLLMLLKLDQLLYKWALPPPLMLTMVLLLDQDQKTGSEEVFMLKSMWAEIYAYCLTPGTVFGSAAQLR
jgi:hypothetical protein